MITKFAGALLVEKNGSLLLQRRDDKPDIASPGMLSIFGGRVETGESFLQTAIREIEEETGHTAHITDNDLMIEFENSYPEKTKLLGAIYLIKDIDMNALNITEGKMEILTTDKISQNFHEIVPSTCLAISLYINKYLKR